MKTIEEKNSFDYLLGFYCTPTLAGIKCANLFSIRRTIPMEVEQNLKRLNEHFNPRGVFLKKLCFCRKNDLILVYNKSLLEEAIHTHESREFLMMEGYPLEDGLDATLEYLAVRLRTQSNFPHEIGVFLGYPIEDVLGFTQNGGQNYKLSGYWKVYGDANSAKLLFDRFTRCRENVCTRLGNGISLHQIFKSA